MIDPDYVELGEEYTVASPGHTLSIVNWHGQLRGFLGLVNFEAIHLWRGQRALPHQEINPDLEPIITKRRTASAIVVDNKLHLFCARKAGFNRKDIFRCQQIEHWVSDDTWGFKKVRTITDGSAPFIFSHDGVFYLYYHRRIDNLHRILVRRSEYLEGLKEALEIQLAKRDSSFSVPSMASLNSKFWLTCEELVDQQWRTILYKGYTPTGPFESPKVLLDAPCVYQHMINGLYFITYSRKVGEDWDVRLRMAE